MTDRPEPRPPTLGEALTPLFAIALFLAVGYAYLGWRVEVMLVAAAGVAGVVKVLMAMRRGELPPTLESEPLNPHVELEGSRGVDPVVRCAGLALEAEA